jgi:hypothetical protein
MGEINKWDAAAIEYTDVDALRSALVGRTITETRATGDEYSKVISFVLDDGSVLNAHATEGGCACSNGCFTVANPEQVSGTILGVEVAESSQSWDGTETPVTPGSISDGTGVLRLFVYDELGKHTLVQSEGSDNGYYGWGYFLSVQQPEVTA